MVYQFRATIPESKIFFRVYEIKGDMSLFKFNLFLVDDLGFSPDQMVLFEGYDDAGTLCSEYGLFDLGDGSMDTVTFDKIAERGEVELHYCFDLRNGRYIKLVLEGEGETSAMRAYPRIVAENGQNPDQFRARYEEAPAVPKLHPYRDSAVVGDVGDEDDDLDDEDEEEDDDKIFDGEELYEEGEDQE